MADTPGARILAAARRACTLFGGANVASFDTEWCSLKPLAARADAAERLAKAHVARIDLDRRWRGSRGNDGSPMSEREYHRESGAALREYDEALAAWRAIEGEVTG